MCALSNHNAMQECSTYGLTAGGDAERLFPMLMRRLFMLLAIAFLVFSASFVWALTFDFSDKKQLERWEIVWEQNQATWEIKDGVLEVESPGTRWDFLVLKDVEFTDGVIEFKLKWLSGTYCEFGVAYRLQLDDDKLPHYNVHLSTVEPALRWGRVDASEDGGQWATVARPPVKGWGKTPVDKWFSVKIEVKDDNHKVYAEGELVHEEKGDNTYKKGAVALMGYSGMAEKAIFDDFSVEGPGIPPSAVQPTGKLPLTWGVIKSTF